MSLRFCSRRDLLDTAAEPRRASRRVLDEACRDLEARFPRRSRCNEDRTKVLLVLPDLVFAS